MDELFRSSLTEKSVLIHVHPELVEGLFKILSI